MPDTRTPGGSPAQDISRKAVQILREYTGRGPTKARTVISDDTVAIVLGDTLTKGERTLVAMGEEKHVLLTRHNYQFSMRNDLVELVEEECGQTVEAFFSDNHIDPDYGVEFFLLNPRQVENGVNSSDVHAGRTG
jgi:uncharacterized protein YbcI